MKFRAILIDPPYEETLIGKFKKTRHSRPDKLTYPTLSIERIKELPIPDLADVSSHLWLWTTNRTLRQGFELLEAWGFKYLAPIHWIKPSGFGAWFVSRSQTLLFGYKGKLEMKNKFKPNVVFAPSRKHSQKPECSYQLIEQVSYPPYLELFARHKQGEDWTPVGNAISGEDIFCNLKNLSQQLDSFRFNDQSG